MSMKFKPLLAATTIASVIAAAPTVAEEIVFSGISPTSQDYAMAVAWSNVLARTGSEHSITVVDNGSVKGLRLLGQGRVHIAPVGSPHYLDATSKSGKFEKDPDRLVEQYKNMSVLFAIRTDAGQYVARVDSGVGTIPDIKNKKIAIGRPGGNAGRVTQALFKAHGIDLEAGAADGQYLKYQPALEQMANGTMDATFVWGGIPSAAIDNASRTMKLNFFSPDPANLESFRANITNGQYYVLQEVPAEVINKAYGGRVQVGGSAFFWTFPFMLAVRNDMPEDVAYALTKAFWENVDEIRATSPALSLISKDTALESLSAPVHPGAEKYYREVGLQK